MFGGVPKFPDLRGVLARVLAYIWKMREQETSGLERVMAHPTCDNERETCLQQRRNLLGKREHAAVIRDEPVPVSAMLVKRQQDPPVIGAGWQTVVDVL